MNLIAHGRLTDLGALLVALVATAVIFWVVVVRAYAAEPARLVWPHRARREARRRSDAADLAAANEADH